MKRLVPVAVLLGLIAGLAGATAAQAGNGGSNGQKNFTCTNQGGGPNHTVYCGGILNGNTVTVNVADGNVLSDNQLTVLSGALDDEAVLISGLDPATQVKDIDLTVVDTYLTKFNLVLLVSQVTTCVGSVSG